MPHPLTTAAGRLGATGNGSARQVPAYRFPRKGSPAELPLASRVAEPELIVESVIGELRRLVDDALLGVQEPDLFGSSAPGFLGHEVGDSARGELKTGLDDHQDAGLFRTQDPAAQIELLCRRVQDPHELTTGHRVFGLELDGQQRRTVRGSGFRTKGTRAHETRRHDEYREQGEKSSISWRSPFSRRRAHSP